MNVIERPQRAQMRHASHCIGGEKNQHYGQRAKAAKKISPAVRTDGKGRSGGGRGNHNTKVFTVRRRPPGGDKEFAAAFIC
jgi:hypothetical protein